MNLRLLIAAAAAVATLAGCGGDEAADKAAIEEARREGARVARQNARIKDLQEEVREAKRSAGGAAVPSAAAATTPSAPTPSVPSSYVSTYVPFSPSKPGYGYVAEVPSGGGWSGPTESVPAAGRHRTTWRGPDGTLLLIDYTPDDVPQLGGGYDAADTSLQTRFGPALKYTFSESESLPDCNGRPCVDFMIDDGSGGGWAVLGGGPNLSVAETIASHVAQSIGYGD